jgi:hypothetical protein
MAGAILMFLRPSPPVWRHQFAHQPLAAVKKQPKEDPPTIHYIFFQVSPYNINKLVDKKCKKE